MYVLIIAATSFEIQPAIEFIESNAEKYQRHKISFLTTGVGIAATTYSLTKAIFEKRPDIILQAVEGDAAIVEQRPVDPGGVRDQRHGAIMAVTASA